MYDAFLGVAGVEIINAARTQAYVAHQMPTISLRRRSDLDTLHVALEDEPYESPLLDGADWVDSADPATHGFYGMYPLSIEGMGSSTTSAEVTESLVSGGTVGESRDGTRGIRVTGLLLGEDQLAVEAGLTWLRHAIRTSSCGTHGATCGSADMRFFLAKPEVCKSKWSDVVAETVTIPFFGVNASRSPIIYDWTNRVDPLMPARAEWQVGRSDGVIVQWGRQSSYGPEILEISEPTILQRTSFVNNPSFATGVSGYGVTPGSFLQRVATGGMAGGSYAKVIDESYPSYRTNWMANSRFDFSPAVSGWRSNGAMSRVVDVSAPVGDNTGRFDLFSGLGAAYGTEAYGTDTYGGVELSSAGAAYGTEAYGTDPYGGVGSSLAADITLLGPPAPVQSTFSFWVSPNSSGVVNIFDNMNVLMASKPFTSTASWSRVFITSTMGANYVAQLTTGGSSLVINGTMLEEGATLGSYFDGSFPDVPADFTDYFYLGSNPALAASRLLVGERTPYTVTLDAVETNFGPVVASFDLRSRSSATVTAKLVSLDDGTVLSTITVDPAEVWTRYVLATEFGRNIALTIDGIGTADMGRFLIESGESVLPYFDGGTPPEPGYETSWLGAPNNSYSRTSWTGVADYIEPDSDFRPFLSVLSGRLPAVPLVFDVLTLIGMDEQLEPFERNYHRVSAIRGPIVLERPAMTSGAAIKVEIIFTAATPYAFSLDRPIDTTNRSSSPFKDAQAVITNIVDNGRVQVNLNRWALWPGTGQTLTRTAVTAAPTAFSAQMNATTSTTGGLYYVQPSIVASSRYTFSADVRVSGVPQDIQPGIEWWNAANTVKISTEYGATRGVGPSSVRLSVTGKAPLGAGIARITFYRAGSAVGAWAAGQAMQVFALMGTRDGVTYNYFDGSTPSDSTFTYSWAGTVNASASRRVSTVVAAPDYASILVDPDCAPTPLPPRAPAISDLCIDEVFEWNRFYVDIPGQDVAAWASTVPTLTLSTTTSRKRQVRVRFHPNPFNYAREAVDPTAYCGEFILSHLPPNAELTVNGMTERAFAQVAGSSPIAADHLLYGTGGSPMMWPEMSCAIPYVMTVDFPLDDPGQDMEISLVLNRKE